MSTSIDNISQQKSKLVNAANLLTAEKRQNIALEAIKGVRSITGIAQNHGVSRKFIYMQKGKALDALSEAFAKSVSDDDVLFQIPVTKAWIMQAVLTLALTGHSPYRGMQQSLASLCNHKISLGNIHNILKAAALKARAINAQEDLSQIKKIACDEIFQNGSPVLVGCDAESTYCFSLQLTEQRDGESWALVLMDAQQRGLNPIVSAADFGTGLRCGLKQAFPMLPCQGDVFHAKAEITDLMQYLNRRAYASIEEVYELTRKLAKVQAKIASSPKKRKRKQTAEQKKEEHEQALAHANKEQALAQKLLKKQQEADAAIALVDNIQILADWTSEMLEVVGPMPEERKLVLQFIVEELRRRECQSHRIKSVATLLENHLDELLHFSKDIEQALKKLALKWSIDIHWIKQLYLVQSLAQDDLGRLQIEEKIHKYLKRYFHPILKEIKEIIANTLRASSVVENLNSRLRNYFFLRKELGNDYLELLRFFLNHQRFLRSEKEERVGRSPAEILSGKELPHWLEMLGFTLFEQAA